MTAEELMNKLQSDPAYVQQMKDKDREWQERVIQNHKAAAPIVADLVGAGFNIESIADLRHQGKKYPLAIPILLRWLPQVDNMAVKEEIVRDLSVPWAKPQAAPALIEEFQRGDPVNWSGLRWTIGNALSIVADDSVFPEIAQLARDRKYGRAREMLALALGNMRNPAAVDVLIELLDDRDVAGHAVMGLGKLKAAKARSKIEPFLQHEKAWVRKEAKKALAKIDRKRS